MGTRALPTPTRDVERATQDMDEFGYTLIADALGPEQVSAMRERLIEQALCEAKARWRVDLPRRRDGDRLRPVVAQQGERVARRHRSRTTRCIRCSTMPSRRRSTRSCRRPRARSEVHRRRRWGRSSSVGTSAPPGGEHRDAHRRPRADFHIDQKWAAGHLDYPIVVTVFYLLTDFNADNGCTLRRARKSQDPDARSTA